jgi:hypothetical protein
MDSVEAQQSMAAANETLIRSSGARIRRFVRCWKVD